MCIDKWLQLNWCWVVKLFFFFDVNDCTYGWVWCVCVGCSYQFKSTLCAMSETQNFSTNILIESFVSGSTINWQQIIHLHMVSEVSIILAQLHFVWSWMHALVCAASQLNQFIINIYWDYRSIHHSVSQENELYSNLAFYRIIDSSASPISICTHQAPSHTNYLSNHNRCIVVSTTEQSLLEAI